MGFLQQKWFSFFFIFIGSHAIGQIKILPEQLLSEYVQVKSVTGNEAPAGKFLLEKCHEAGLYTHIFNDEINSFNFTASLYPLEKGKPNIVFHTHCDVVYEGDSSKWTYPPYSGTITDSAVWGRGAIDNKALAVMEFLAISEFADTAKTTELPFNVTLLVVSNEEEGGKLGAGIIVNNYLEFLNPVVVFGEGGSGAKNVLASNPSRTVFGISIIHKQGIWLDLSLKNNGSAHGAISSKNNINTQLVTALNRLIKQKHKIKVTDASAMMTKELSRYEKGPIKCVYCHPKLFFPIVKTRILNDPLLSLIFTDSYNITNIHSPHSSINSVADEVHAIIDCRFLEPTKSEDLIRQIYKKAKCPDLDIQVLKESPTAAYTHPDVYYYWLRDAILQNEPEAAVVPILFPAIADNNYFRNKKIPTYGFVPCCLTSDDAKRIHNIDEHISISCLYQGIDIYRNFIRRALNN